MKKNFLLGATNLALSALIALTTTAFQGTTSQVALAHATNDEPVIAELNVTPNPFNPAKDTQLTLTFKAENTQGKTFNWVVYDFTKEMMVGGGNLALDEGINTLTWKPGPDLENGTYTFAVDTYTPEKPGKVYKMDFQVLNPESKPLVISDLKVEPKPYKLSDKVPLTLSFNVQNAQTRGAAFGILDSTKATVYYEEHEYTLHEGLNTIQVPAYMNPKLKAGTYFFAVVAPLQGDRKLYSTEFQIEE